jgi:hypothetical protein
MKADLKLLMKRLKWADSKGITHVKLTSDGTRLVVSGKLPDGEMQQIYPMSQEEKDETPGYIDTRTTTPISYDQGDREFGDIGSGDFSGEYRDSDYINESIEKIKNEFKRYL